MKKLENLSLLTLVVAVSAALVACDVDDKDEADGGAGGGGGGGGAGAAGGAGGGGGGGGGGTYNFLYIVDISADQNMQGTPGVDICGVEATCAGTTITGDDATLTAGEGTICGTMMTDICGGTDRGDAAQSLDSGMDCEAASMGTSHYVSIGVTGALAIQFGQDLRGCSIQVVENNQGATVEGYEVHVCADAAGMDCVGDAPVHTAAMGGVANFDVPAP